MAESNPTESEEKPKNIIIRLPPLGFTEPDFGTERVTIYVGPKRKEFIVHKKLLCESAEFFKAAFSSGYEETNSNEMYMPEDHPGALSLYIKWIYRGTIALGHTESHLHSLYYFYFLAEKICLVHLKDKVIDSIQDMAREYDLKDKLFTKFLVQEIQKHTTQMQVGKVMGLGGFCLDMMIYTHRLRHGPGLSSTTIENNGGKNLASNEDMVSEIDMADQKFVWELSRTDFDFFKIYFDEYIRLSKWENKDLSDYRIRDEDDLDNRCIYHCHDLGWDCRAAPQKTKLVFVADVTETAT